jgi:hypothetical protein
MISDDYKKQLQELQSKKKFNSALVKYSEIKNFIVQYQPTSLLDYGCSHGDLIKQLKIDFSEINVIDGYDPGVSEFEIIKQPSYDCLISNDVIEHIESEFLDQTLIQMETLFERYAWFIIACYPAKKKLPDGRNAHLTIETPEWWLEKISKLFVNSKIVWHEIKDGPELRMILEKNYPKI